MWELNDEEKATENIKPISFMGYNLNELGEVEGAIPVLKHFTDELHDRIIQEHEGYVYRMCMQLDIDPDVLKKQLIEIRRLNTIIREKDEQIEKMKMVASSWIMSLEDVRASEVNNRRFEVLRELEKRMENNK